MAGPVELREFGCPSCGARTPLDVRFVRWCLDCGYGADPSPPVLAVRATRRAEREQSRALRMYESLRTAQDLRPNSMLRLGMPPWTVLSGPERIALLGHEFGHQVNGDPGQGPRWFRRSSSCRSTSSPGAAARG